MICYVMRVSWCSRVEPERLDNEVNSYEDVLLGLINVLSRDSAEYGVSSVFSSALWPMRPFC